MSVDAGVLLLYNLLYRNTAFLQYVLARTDMDMIVVPLLRQLYDGRGKHPHQLYMPLIALLVLSQHAPFHAQLHAHITAVDLTWFKERRLETIDLGSLVMIIVIRTVLRNFTTTRDVYLFTNCLALLGNMARYMYDLHPYAADRLLLLVRVMFKRVSRLTDQTELDMYIEFLRLSVQITHACLCATLQRNAHLIYALLQYSELLDSLCTLPAVADSASVLRDTTAHFSHVVTPSEDMTIADALSAISTASKSIHIIPAPPLNFTYCEDVDSAEFFGPYVLALVAGYMGWDMLPSRLAQLTDVCMLFVCLLLLTCFRYKWIHKHLQLYHLLLHRWKQFNCNSVIHFVNLESKYCLRGCGRSNGGSSSSSVLTCKSFSLHIISLSLLAHTF